MALDYEDVLVSMLPDGYAWKPKNFELGTTPEGNIVNNGDFEFDLNGWNVTSTSTGGDGASVTWSSGKALFYYWAV
jgi:hypothetical protein